MNFYYSLDPNSQLEAVSIEDIEAQPENNIEKGWRITFQRGDSELHIYVNAKVLLNACGETEFKDCTTYYAVLDNDGHYFVNKFVETLYTKQSGTQYTRAIGKYVPVQIYVPFAGTTLDEATIRVVSKTPAVYNGEEIESTRRVGITPDALTGFLWKTVPTLSVGTTSTSPVSVQVMLDNQPLQRAGIKVYGRTSNGSKHYSGETDQNGVALLHGEPGEIIEIGFKYYTNMVQTKIME
jgi:hypothetical protein